MYFDNKQQEKKQSLKCFYPEKTNNNFSLEWNTESQINSNESQKAQNMNRKGFILSLVKI